MPRTAPARPAGAHPDPGLAGLAPTPRWRGPVLGAALAVLVAAATLLAGAGPVAAHDRLLSSDPEDGATLTQVPVTVTLTFSADVIADGTFVEVSADGTGLGEVPVAVDGRTVTATLPDDLTSGSYEVAWQVTSNDGHAIADVLTFTLDAPRAEPTAPEPVRAEPVPTESDPTGPAPATPLQEVTGTPAAEPTVSPDPDVEGLSEERDAAISPAIGGLLLVAAAAAVGAGAVVLARRRGGFDLRNGPPGQH